MTSQHDSDSLAPRFSRRTLGLLTAGGGLAGASWTVGLSSLARGRGTHLTIVGERAWQVVLLESGTSRVLMLIGEFEESPERAISLVLTTLRQHVDLVLATSSAMPYLSLKGRFSNSIVIHLTGSLDQADTPQVRALRDHLHVSAGEATLQIERITRDAWLRSAEVIWAWMVTLRVNGTIVTFADSLAVIAEHAPVEASLAIAPTGSPRQASAQLPGVSIAVNAYGLDRDDTWTDNPAPDAWLVRIFPTDSARFTFVDSRISIPDWAQAFGNQDVPNQ